MRRTRVEFHLVYNEMARRLLLKQDTALIALEMCMPEDTVKRLMRRPAFQEALHALEERAFSPVDTQLQGEARNLRDELDKVALESFDRLRDLLTNSQSEAIVRDVGQDFLDRAGYGKVTKVEATEVLKVDPITASVITSALRKEEEGRKRLKDRVPTKPASEVEHPLARRMREFGGDKKSGEPASK